MHNLSTVLPQALDGITVDLQMQEEPMVLAMYPERSTPAQQFQAT